MTYPRLSPRSVAVTLLIALILATAVLAQDSITNRGVQKRVNTMRTANVAITTLSNMMGAKTLFNQDHARSARRDLIKTTRSIPSVFRRAHTDPFSHAQPHIWSQWRDFKARATVAQQAARDINTGSLSKLRLTLPKLVIACHSCHKIYRTGPR